MNRPLVFLALLTSACVSTSAIAAERRPNIVFILADDKCERSRPSRRLFQEIVGFHRKS